MAKSPMDGGKKLPSSFTPGEWDVICHKGRDCYNHGESSETEHAFLYAALS